MVKGLIIKTYTFLFARKFFLKLNQLLFDLAVRGLGILNYKNNEINGESRFLNEFFENKENCIVFDVGANIGNYAQAVLNNCPTADIHAFEPHPATFRRLSARFGKFPNVLIANHAVGSKSGQLVLYDHEDNDGSSHASLFRDVIEGIHHSRSTMHDVSVVTLDAYILEHRIAKIDLLKIDTEGSELDVLKGAKAAIKARIIKSIHFEFNEMNVASRVYFKDFWDLLSGYSFYRMLPDGLIKIGHYSALTCEIFAYQNIVAILCE